MTTIKLRRGTAGQWTALNPVLAEGEPGFESDTGKEKIGDGVSTWSVLPYFVRSTELTSAVSDAQTAAEQYALDLRNAEATARGNADAALQQSISDEIAAIMGGVSPSTLDTINEIASAMLSDESGAAALTALVGSLRNLSDSTFSTALKGSYTRKPTTDLGDWTLLRRDTSDATNGVAWTTGSSLIAHIFGWVIASDPTGVATTDTANAQAATDSAASRATGSVTFASTVWFKPGTYLLNASWLFNQQSMVVKGAGSATIFKWSGAAGGNMIDVRDSTRIAFSDFTLLGDATNSPGAGIFFNAPTVPIVGTNEYVSVRNVMFGRRDTIDGAGYAPMQYGIRQGGLATGNNDTLYVDNCQFHDCSVAGIYVQNVQARWNMFTNCTFNGCATGLYILGNSIAIGMNFNRSSVQDIYVDNCSLDLFGYQSEHAAKLFTQMGGASLTIRGGSPNLQAEIGSVWADCTVSNGGRLDLSGLYVYDQFSANPKLWIHGSSSNTLPSSVTIRGCMLPNGDSDTGYTIDGYSAGTPLYVDIKQGSYWRSQLVQSLNALRKFSPPASRQNLGEWIQSPTVAASQAAVAMNRSGQTIFTKTIALRPGSITVVSLYINVARTAGSCTVQVTKNGTAMTGTSVVVDGSSTSNTILVIEQGVAAFNAGDQIGVKITTTSDWTPTANFAVASVEVTYTT